MSSAMTMYLSASERGGVLEPEVEAESLAALIVSSSSNEPVLLDVKAP